MDASSPNSLRLWDGAAMAVIPEGPAGERPFSGPHQPGDFAERLFAWEAMNPPVRRPARDAEVEPYTLQWFLNIEGHRHGRQGRWLPRLLEFSRHSGETLLGLGNGLGTDWLQYARHGAEVVVCSPSAEQLALIRRNFELRGLGGRFLHAAATTLPLESASIDVACVSSLLHEVAEPRGVVEEVYRVLKPGGKVLAVTPARYDVNYWYRACFWWRHWRRPRAEACGAASARRGPAPVTFSSRQLRALFDRFAEHRIYKRQLRRSEVPHVWRWMPLSLLERCWGHVLVLKAFKPLSAAIAAQAAA
jgi:SAM-dependent methyltransferase